MMWFFSLRLRRVALERADRGNVTNGVPQGVNKIEECRCPPGHTGTSCEECEPGYWRDPNVATAQGQSGVDAFLGLVNPVYRRVCVPCDCNGRADSCDPHTGHCLVSYFPIFVHLKFHQYIPALKTNVIFHVEQKPDMTRVQLSQGR